MYKRVRRGFRNWYGANWWRMSGIRRCEWAAISDLLHVEPADRALEVGAGSGWASRILRSMGAQVMACDIGSSAEFVANRPDLERQGIRTAVADAQHLPYRGAAFDHVVSVCVLEHIPRALQAIRECLRVLRPGGAFVFSVDSLPVSLLGECLRERHRNLYGVLHTWSRDDIIRIGQQLGVSETRVRPILRSEEAVAELASLCHEGTLRRESKLRRLLSLLASYLRALRVQRAEEEQACAVSSSEGIIVVARFTK